ncbi:type IV secretion system protein [Kingella kingae]|uniref:type IV secretion system protein n=1 Tax=Kingella kingae TaxID=504 RepID=UPI00254CD893|nr:type IV secretion system protein [Kingella kingae]MDK4563548.1 type IV secretion system protein [Kingella kingae]MDK4578141.1 type IV secretion system protein [Kingella kingae]MDK4608410.1 type IV secretion system protein [Kingella kingae]MDK4625706.1 type IV secretion system protein [Kingella kingae]MDK4673584.1 type IV secretion system protein [Kingella kingae]
MMKTKLTKMAAIVLSGCLMCSSVSAGGIPTFDAKAVLESIERGKQLKTQIENQISQIQEMRNQLAAIKGSRGMGNLARQAINYDLNVPSEWSDLHKLTSAQQQARLKGSQYDAAQSDNLLNQNLTMLSKFTSENQQRLNTIDSLINQINTTTDIKASSDLRNRLSAEQLKFQNQQTMLDQMARMYDLQEKVQARQYSNREACLARHLVDKNYAACK